MFYEFCDNPIISRRVDRRSAKEKRRKAETAQKRRESFLDAFEDDIGKLVAMGFYNSTPRKLAHGVEVWNRQCTFPDKWGEWQKVSVPTLAVCLPNTAASPKLLKMNPAFWEESQTYYWGFKQKSKIIPFWCCLDLLNRLLNLPDWRECESIPLRWRLDAKAWGVDAAIQVEKINSGRFKLSPPPLRFSNTLEGWSLNDLRHNCTPYDYEWQTGKRERDEARNYWNEQITQLK